MLVEILYWFNLPLQIAAGLILADVIRRLVGR